MVNQLDEQNDRDFNELTFKIYLNGLINYFWQGKLSDEEFIDKIMALIKQFKKTKEA